MGWVKTEKTNKLSKLGDIDFTTTAPVDGNVLVYDETNDVWAPGASVIQKTLAEYNVLTTADKMNGSIYKITDKALIYCLDEEYHSYKEITSADYAQLTSDEKNNGTLYIITDEETTAADIPYSAGVSVADKIDDLNTPTELTLNVASGITSASKAYQISDKLIVVNFECTFASASSSYVNCFTIDWLTAFSTSNFAVVSDGGTNQGYIQAYWTGSTIQVRMDSPKAVRYRGQLYIIAV